MIADREQARLALVGLLILFVAALWIPIDASAPDTEASTSASSIIGSTESGRSDAAMFNAVVNRLRAGESFYPAMGEELRAGRYPTASVFNWRTPALYVGLAAIPPSLLLPLTVALGVLLLGAFMLHLSRHGTPEGTVIGLVLSASAVVMVMDAQGRWLTETWTGAFIGLSAAAYIRGAWLPGALLGLAALFLRELAAPYCVVCVWLALRARRTSELRVWAVGFAVFGVYYAWHASQVLGQMRPGDLAHPTPWLRFGGLGFWLATIGTNKVLFATPRLLLAIASVLLVAALWARALPLHVRWSVVAYACVFLVAGQRFNDYWGLVAAFINALAIAYGPEGLLTLGRRAVVRSAAQ